MIVSVDGTVTEVLKKEDERADFLDRFPFCPCFFFSLPRLLSVLCSSKPTFVSFLIPLSLPQLKFCNYKLK